MFHATLLRQYNETEVYRANFPRPTPELIKGEEVYEVENILRHRKRGHRYQYYMKWKGYPISKASWEPEEVFSDEGDLLTRYKKGINLTTINFPYQPVEFDQLLSLIDYYQAELKWRTLHLQENLGCIGQTGGYKRNTGI